MIASMFDGIIDLSHHNGPSAISGLETAYKSGIRAVIHKATQGTKYIDPQFYAVRNEARRIGMLFGSYHFGTSSDPVEQVEHYLRTVGGSDSNDSRNDESGLSNDLLILDFESNGSLASDSMSSTLALIFTSQLSQKVGRKVGLYSSSSYIHHLPQSSSPIFSFLWLARYSTNEPKVDGWPSWDLWQYTDKAIIPGIGRCDRSRFRGGYEDLERFWNEHGTSTRKEEGK